MENTLCVEKLGTSIFLYFHISMKINAIQITHEKIVLSPQFSSYSEKEIFPNETLKGQ